jgi:photosystem II stability/assembly factor-like uncharacterized protein
MKRAIAFLPLLIPVAVWAQPAPDPQAGPWADLLSNLKPRSLGPTNMGGRITDIAVYEKQPRIFYIASASGGLWKTENAGLTVTPVFDRESSVSLGACAVSQKDPNVVWAATGEATSRNSTAWGDGIYKSTDGGKTWTHMGLRETMHISRVVIDPRDDNTVYVGALGRLWGPNKERGIYKTTDGGKTWQQLLFVDDTTGVADLQMDPKNPNTLLAALWTRDRKAYDFTSGGPNSGMYKTTNGGKTWKKITKGLPPSPLGRIGISYFRNDPKIVVATIEYQPPNDPPAPGGTGGGTTGGDDDGDGDGDGLLPRLAPQGGAGGGQGGAGGGQGRRGGGQGAPGGGGQGQRRGMDFGGGTFRSTDGGESWTRVNQLNPRPFYFSRPLHDPVDPNRIYICGVNIHASDDAGKTFRTMRANVHPDNHALWVDPNDNNYMIIGNDGGVSVTRDRGLNWAHLNNMPLGQFYGVAFDFRKPYWVYGGLQDNGSWGMPTQTTRIGPSWWDVIGVGEGDGFHAQVDPNDWRWLYTESQGGAVNRFDLKTGQRRGIRPRGEGNERLRFNWSTPIYISPWASSTIYVGSNKLFKSVNRGDTWKAISPDLTTNDPTKLKPGAKSVTPENTGAENHCTIITISESPLQEGQIWVGTDDGQVSVTRDGGITWTNVTPNIPGLPANTWCSRVIASKWTDGRAYATFDGHRASDFKPYVYVTEDHGKTWTSLASTLPDYDCVYVIREGDKNQDLLYLGSEMSLRMSFDRGKTWSRFRSDFPTVAVHDVVVHPRENDLVIGTHGRSLWILDVSALEQLTSENREKDVFVAKPQNVQVLSRFGGSSQSWDGDGIYFSPNSQPGTNVCYYLKTAATGDVKVTISDVAGTVSTDLTGPTGKQGLNVVRWNGRLRGRIADAGDYKVVVTVGGKEYVTSVRVEDVDGS